MLDENKPFAETKTMADFAPCGSGLFDSQTSEPVFLNQAYASLIGYTTEEYAAYAHEGKHLLPNDRQNTHKWLSAFQSNGKIDGNECRLLRKDGAV